MTTATKKETTKKETPKNGSTRPSVIDSNDDIWRELTVVSSPTRSWLELTQEQQKYQQQRKRKQKQQQRKRKQPEKDQTNAWVGGMLVTVGVTLALIFGLRHK